MNLALTPLDWLVGILMFGGSIALGLYWAKRAHAGADSAGFFLAGRKMSWPIIGASLFATNIAAQHVVGICEGTYRCGIAAGTIEVAGVLCLGFAAAFLFPHYIKNGVFTIPQFLEMRYNHKLRTFFSGYMLFLAIFMTTAIVLYAGALILQGLLGWNIMATVTLLGICAAIITVIGGFAAVSYTDTIQTIIMIGGCATMLFIGLDKVGGWAALQAKVPDSLHLVKPYDDPDFPFAGMLMAAIYSGIFYWGSDQTQVQRILGADGLKHARWGAMFATLLKLTPVFLFAFPGVIMLALRPGGKPEHAFVMVLNDLLPSGVRGLVLAAVLAAIVSSLDSVTNAVSTLFVRDFALRVRPNTTESRQVLLGRLTILAATALGIAAAYLVYKSPKGVYRYYQALGSYLFIPLTPAIVFGILSKKITAKAAGASIAVGCAFVALFLGVELVTSFQGKEAAERLFPWLHTSITLSPYYRGAWGVLIVTAVLFGVSSFTAKTPPEKLVTTTVAWHEKMEPFSGLTDWRLHLAILAILSAAIYIWLW